MTEPKATTGGETTGERTIADFNEQWSTYTDNDGFYGSPALFADIIEPLLTTGELKDKTVADIGSGTGRIVQMIAEAGAAKIVAVEPAPGSFEVLRRNTAAIADRIEYLNTDGAGLPGGDWADYVLSIGVVHHIPEPDAVIQAAHSALKPGGQVLLWLYGHEGNEAYLRFVEPLRKLTVKMPHLLLVWLCHLLTNGLYIYATACEYLPLPLRGYMRDVIAKLPYQKRFLVVYDQLNPHYAKYYKRHEAEELLSKAGFKDVRTHHRHGYSWSVVGTK